MGASYDAKPYRRLMIEVFGGRRFTGLPRTSPRRAVRWPRIRATTAGSLGIAISEAVEGPPADPTVRYALGSVLNHVLLHQTIIGEEALLQMEQAGDTPTLIVGCTGGGSNFAGLSFPFLREKLAGQDRSADPRRGASVLPVAHDRARTPTTSVTQRA